MEDRHVRGAAGFGCNKCGAVKFVNTSNVAICDLLLHVFLS